MRDSHNLPMPFRFFSSFFLLLTCMVMMVGCEERQSPDLWRPPGSDAEAGAELVRLRSMEPKASENLQRQFVLCLFLDQAEAPILAGGLCEGLRHEVDVMARILFAGIKHPRPSVRANAIRVVGLQRIHGFEKMLRAAVSDGDEAVRVAAIQSLGLLQDKKARFLFLLALKDNGWRVRANAADALAALKDASTLKYLLREIPDPDGFAQMKIEDAFLLIAPGAKLKTLRSMLKKKLPEQKRLVALALAQQKDASGAVILRESLESDALWRREEVRLALENLE